MKSPNKITTSFEEIAKALEKLYQAYGSLGITAEAAATNLAVLMQQRQLNQSLMNALTENQNKKDLGELSPENLTIIELDIFDKILLDNDYFDL